MVTVKEAFARARDFARETFQTARERFSKEETTEQVPIPPLKESVRIGPRPIKLIPTTIDIEKAKVVEEEKKKELEQELLKETKIIARKTSLRSAVEDTQKFQQDLKEAFSELDKLAEQKKRVIITEKGKKTRLTAKQLQSFIEKKKAAESKKFFEQLESGITKFEEIEVPKAVKAAKSTAEFLRETARRTMKKITTVTGQVKPEFTTESAKKFSPTFTKVPETGLRQKVGVGLGKAFTEVSGGFLIEDEARKRRAQREGVAFIKGLSIGFLAPSFQISTPEEAATSLVGTQVGIKFIVAPLAAKTITVISAIAPKLKEKLLKLPFIHKKTERISILEPITKEVSFDVKVQELVGVRVGGERTAAGTAFAFESADDVGAGIAEQAKIFKITSKLGDKGQIIVAGKKELLGSITFVGEPQLKLPSQTAFRLLEKTGRVPIEFPIAEVSRVKTFGSLPAELISEGEPSVMRFLAGQRLTPEKGIDIFFEVSKPFEGRGIKGAKDIISLIGHDVRAKTFDVSFARLPGEPFPKALALKQIAEKVSLATQKPIETVFSLGKLKVSAGAAIAPLQIVTRTRVISPELTSVKGSLFTIIKPVTTGFQRVTKEFETLGFEPSALSLLTGIAPLGVKPIVKTKVRTKVDTRVAVKPKVILKSVVLQKFALREKTGVIVKTRTAVKTKVATIQRVKLAPPLVKVLTPTKVAIRVPSKRLIPQKTTIVKPEVTFRPIPLKLPGLIFRKSPKKIKRRTSIQRVPIKRKPRNFIPRADPISLVVTGLKLLRRRKKLIITPKIKKAAKKLKKRGIRRFPTAEIISGELKIKPRGGLVTAFRELGIKPKKEQRRKRRVKFI